MRSNQSHGLRRTVTESACQQQKNGWCRMTLKITHPLIGRFSKNLVSRQQEGRTEYDELDAPMQPSRRIFPKPQPFSLPCAPLKACFGRKPGLKVVPGGLCYLVTLLRGTIVNRTYDTHENLYISLFLPTIFGPIYYGPP